MQEDRLLALVCLSCSRHGTHDTARDQNAPSPNSLTTHNHTPHRHTHNTYTETHTQWAMGMELAVWASRPAP